MSFVSKARRFTGVVLVACASIALPGFTPSAHALDVTDALGRKVSIHEPIERIVVNFNFEEFTAVGGLDAWKKVVGISRVTWEGWRPANFNRYKALIPNLAAMPDIGNSDDGNLSVEKIIALKPDVFLVADWTYKSLKDSAAQIEAAGIPIVVIDYNAQLLDRHLASTRALGLITGQPARGEELAQFYKAKYDDILARVARAAPKVKPRVYVEGGAGGADVIGNSYDGTMWGKIFDLLGADNIAKGKLAGPWGPLNAEAVLAANPDAIFIAGSSWQNKPHAVRTGYDTSLDETLASLAPYAQRPGWSGLNAVKSGNLNAIEHGLCRSLYDFVAMEFVAKRLYPDAFADVDPVADFKAYHAKYLPVAYSGNWMATLKP